jgi:hypothetical protein
LAFVFATLFSVQPAQGQKSLRIFFKNLKAQWTIDSDDAEMIGIVPTVVCLPAENGTRSKRNFHRPQSNCWVAFNLIREIFILLVVRRETRASVAGGN